MNLKFFHILLFFLGTCFFPWTSFAQEKEAIQSDVNQDNLGNVTDAFQEHFFEALQQKAIGNHEKAVVALEKCVSLQPEKAILYVELGKNFKAMEKYPLAEKNFLTALKKRPESPYVRIELYEVYMAVKNFPKAIQVVTNIVDFNPDYYEDLVDLYMLVKKPEKALQALKTWENITGPTEDSKKLRQDIFKATGNREGQIAYFKAEIEKYPKNPENYLQLINLYGENQNLDAAFSWAKKLQELYPDSEKVHLALYQLYLNKEEYDKAIASMKKVLGGKELEEATKMKVLQDFIGFTKKHPEYRQKLTEVVDLAIKTGESMASNKELGDFYRDRNKTKALQYYTKSLENNFNDIETIENALWLQLDLKQYKNAVELSEKALAIFPSRAILYFSQGVAYNGLQQYWKALESLELGLSYLIDNASLKIDFYQQMVIAHRGLQQEEKAKLYEKKITEIENKLE